MELYDRLYRLYSSFDVSTLRAYQEFVDLFPPIDSRVALEYWETAREELDRRKAEIESETGEAALAGVAARATMDQAFGALDLATKYDRPVNSLVLDVDETLRSAGQTDNEIPRKTLYLMTAFLDAGVPIVICTGQTLENVKGFLIQGLGNELVHSGDLSIVYEGGAGVFTPGQGERTKQLLSADLDADVRAIFDTVRSRVLSAAPDRVRTGCHLQGNEFNVTLKPNYETGSSGAKEVIDAALVHLLDLLGEAVATDADPVNATNWVRRHYAERDPEIREALAAVDAVPAEEVTVPAAIEDRLSRVDVGYYEADGVEITSREVTKVTGVTAACEVLGIEDPFALVMGDSKSDLRVMEWAAENDAGIAAAPENASRAVLDHVIRTDELLFDRGSADDILRTVFAMNRLVSVAEPPSEA